MRIKKELFSICELVSKDIFRESLNHVNLKNGYLEASNGHYAARFKACEPEESIDALLPPRLLLSAAKSVKKDQEIEILPAVGLHTEGVYTAKGLGSDLSLNIRDQRKEVRPFPDLEQVTPKGPFVQEMGFDPKYLETIGKAARKAGIKCLRVLVPEHPYTPAIFQDEDNSENYFVLMPMRIEKREEKEEKAA